MTTSYQKDLKIGPPSGLGTSIQKVTLVLSPTGDIQLVEGKDKLSEQLARAIVNDDTSANGLGINSANVSKRYVTTLITLILRNFRQSQIYQTEQSDERCIGFSVFRFGDYIESSSFIRASKQPVTWRFTDNNLANGRVYTYGITRNYATGFESSMIEQIYVAPSQFDVNQTPVIGKNLVAIPGNQSVTLYVDFNRTFRYSELLEAVNDILVQQDNYEPRRFVVSVSVSSLDGNNVSLSSARVNPAKM